MGNLSLPTLITVAAQIACIVHIIRQGRSWLWIWLIIFVPAIGAVVYFIVEVLPDLRAGGRSRGVSLKLPETSGRAIKRLQEKLEFTNTVENRVELARAYLAANRIEEATETIAPALKGVFKDDPVLTLEMAEIHLRAGRPGEALAALDVLDRMGSRDGRQRRQILAARSLEALGRIDEAKAKFEESLGQGSGEEARCAFAQMLARQGEVASARRLFEEILQNAKRGGGTYRRFNREWIDRAKSDLAALPKG